MRWALLLALMVLTGGCLSPARQLDASAVAQLQDGITTRAEVERQFGRPKTIVRRSERTVAEYFYIIHSPPGGALRRTMRVRSLSLLYDERDVVEKHVHHEMVHPVNYGVTAATFGFSAEPRTEWIVRGLTTSNELVGSFGLPTYKTLTPEGQLVYVWVHGRMQRGNQFSTEMEEFLVLLDGAGIVRDFVIRAASLPQ